MSAYTSRVDEAEFRGDAQVLSGFFSSITVENPVGQKFSILMKITNIVQQRKWTLPHLNCNQVQNILDGLKVKKPPDFWFLSQKYKVRCHGCG